MVGMVAFATTADVTSKTTPRARAQGRSGISSPSRCSKSNIQTSLRRTALGKYTRSGTCTRDPIGYEDGNNLYNALPGYMDPNGTVRRSVCQGMQYREDCRKCCKGVPGAGGRRGCENSCNQKPGRQPPTPPVGGPALCLLLPVAVPIAVAEPTPCGEIVIIYILVCAKKELETKDCYDKCTNFHQQCMMEWPMSKCGTCRDKCRANCHQFPYDPDPWQDDMQGFECDWWRGHDKPDYDWDGGEWPRW